MASLPAFTSDGLLPVGEYQMTLSELRGSPLVQAGSGGNDPNWDAVWRATLVDQLEVLARQLWAVGVDEIFVDGSFAEDKSHPNDIDGYFICDPAEVVTGELERKLNLLDPHKVWTWDPASRRAFAGYPKKQLPMWHRYRVELYPHFPGLLTGIRDAHGNELEFPSAFRLARRNNARKGIVKLIREEGAHHDPQ